MSKPKPTAKLMFTHECIENRNVDIKIEQWKINGERAYYYSRTENKTTTLDEIKYCPFCGRELLI